MFCGFSGRGLSVRMKFGSLPQRVMPSPVPSVVTPALKAIYYKIFRIILLIRCFVADLIAPRNLKNSLPPAMLRFRVSESLSTEEFLRVGEHCANLIRQRA